MLDVVIPVYKPGNELSVILKRLLKQDFSVNRIILINTEKEFFDDKYLIDGRIEVHHIAKSEFDHANTRHMGMELSNAEYVLFMTMDAVPADRMLTKNLIDMINQKGDNGSLRKTAVCRNVIQEITIILKKAGLKQFRILILLELRHISAQMYVRYMTGQYILKMADLKEI